MASEHIPDYASCTLPELYQVLNHIDAARVPAAYAVLVEEIDSREPTSIHELLDCWSAMDRNKLPEFAARLEQQIERIEPDAAALQRPTLEVTEANKYKTFWRRFWAAILDVVIISIPFELIGLVLKALGVIGPDPTVLYDDVTYAVALVYYIAMHARYGQTLGKMLTEVKVIHKTEARDITVSQAILRDIVPVIGFLASIGASAVYTVSPMTDDDAIGTFIVLAGAYLFASLFWYVAEVITMLFNRKRRAVHDFIAGTVVVRI